MVLAIKLIKTISSPLIVIAGYILSFIDLKTVVLVYLVYCLYHYITSNAVLHYTKTEKNKKIISSCKSLETPRYKPHFFLPSPTLQLILFGHIQGPAEELEIERESTNEYGTYIEWVSVKSNKKDESSNSNEDKPILLVLPGLTGGKTDYYVQNICYEGLQNNYIPVVYQNRFLNNYKLSEDTHMSLFEDLDEGIDHIMKKYPGKKIYAIGFSYGANMLVHYLGTKNIKKRKIQGGVSVGNPYDMLICQRFLAGTFFDHIILQLLLKNMEKNIESFSRPHKFIQMDINKAKQAKTTKEYDEYTTRRVFGYKSSDHYYRDVSCVHHVEKIDVPLLMISALDDNITTAKAIPYDEASLNENIFLLITDKGGHLCWIDNQHLFKLKRWVDRPAIEFINSIQKI